MKKNGLGYFDQFSRKARKLGCQINVWTWKLALYDHLSDHCIGLIYMPQLLGNQFVAKHLRNQCFICLSTFMEKKKKNKTNKQKKKFFSQCLLRNTFCRFSEMLPYLLTRLGAGGTARILKLLWPPPMRFSSISEIISASGKCLYN